MVATKDVTMEPTIRSLQDDLVGGQINDQYINEKKTARVSFLCDILCLAFPIYNSKISLHSLSELPITWKISGHFNKESGTFVQFYDEFIREVMFEKNLCH